jgi:L,D-transpeptidase YcbB
MRRDPLYLSKKGYSIATWSGQAVAQESVMATSPTAIHLPYNISQPPGSNNALGILKFMFDNSHSVYLHDTNAKVYFNRTNRALSHGCIRVQNPHQLAALLLDSIAVVRMNQQLEKKQTGYIPIRKEMGIYLRYITCDATHSGRILRYKDIYNSDNDDWSRMISYLKKN